jgi:predicted permease
MLVLLMGPNAIGPVMIVLATDLIVFGSLLVILVSAKRDGRMSVGVLGSIAVGLMKNPMVMAITAGLIWASFGIPVPEPLDEFLTLLGAAATPGALFAIGASLASKSAERKSIAIWLSTVKLALHPLAVAFASLVLFDVPPFTASVMIAAAAMPTAGNVYILAQHYGIAPVRVSSTILISTVISIVSLTVVIAMVSG